MNASETTDPWEQARRALDGLPHGAGLNIAHEAVDRHVAAGAGDRAAFRFVDRTGTVRIMTYGELAEASNRFANVLQGLGVGRGDVVAALLGPVPELYVAALGTFKAGGVFTALFSAFGPEPVRVRLAKAGASILVTTDAAWRQKIAPLRQSLPDLAHGITVDAANDDTAQWSTLLAAAPKRFTVPPTDPEEPALLHFTSGTTGSPKGALHVHEAVVAHLATAQRALDLRPGDRYWCTADPGWVTGISYGFIAPLVSGATAIVVDAPFEAGLWWSILYDHRVAVWYTAPTAIRMLQKTGLTPPAALTALRHAASVGEPLDAGAVGWGRETVGRPIHDTWWQTETGAIMIANAPEEPPIPGAMGRPISGMEAAVCRRREGGGLDHVSDPDTPGELALRVGWPSMFRAYLGDDARYRRCFADGYYLSGDLVRRDADGAFWFVGRRDDVIKTAGHLVGPFEVEAALLSHPAVAEAAVIGLPDALIGETVTAYVTAKAGIAADDALRRALLAHARRRLGAAVAPRAITFAADLPKTKSGKILRRLLKSRALGLPDGDLSTLEGGDEGD